MAPQPTYDSPHVQLGRLMVQARRDGLDFEAWWTIAVRPRACHDCGVEALSSPCECGCRRVDGPALVMANTIDPPAGAVRWPTDRDDRVTWQAAIMESKDGWRRAFEGVAPTKQEAALAFLAPGLAALDEVARERERDELGLAAA
jgi:hypothetical protein